LASATINASDAIVIELVQADETPVVVIVRWPAKPTIFHPRRFPSGANAAPSAGRRGCQAGADPQGAAPVTPS
jgi:hypothetical protein